MSRCRTTRRGGITIERRLMRQRTGNSFGRFGHRHEQSERTARKWRESKVAIEGRFRFIRRFDHDGEYRERTGGTQYPTNCVRKQKIADTFAANFLIARETPNEGRWNEVIAWQTFCIFGRQVGDSECEGTQAVETDDPTFIVDGDKNARGFVAIDDERGIVGFYSLSSFTLAIADLPSEYAKRLPRYDFIPSALIGRLARDQKVRGEGVGDLLLADAVRRVINASRSLAVFAIVVEATA